MKRQRAKQFKPDDIREAVLRFIELEDVQSGYLGACSSSPQWLVEQGFPTALVEPMFRERGVSILELLWKLAGIFGADTTEAQQMGFTRKRCARSLAANIKAVIPAIATN